MKTIEEVLAAFEVAALNAGLKRKTRKSYAGTIAEFAGLVKAGTITGPQGYFEHLASVKRVSSNTVWHALNPLKFLYEKVLEKEFGTFDLPRRNRSQPMRAVLTMSEILAMMQTMPRVPRLQAGLLAGCGMRIESDMLTLRLKDVRMEDRVITISRHSYATGLLREGVDIRVIQEQMGHTSLQTTEIYLHTAGKKAVTSPLDAEVARNIIPLLRTA